MSAPTYGVTVTREDDLWIAVVDGLPDVTNSATDVEHFHDLDTEVRDLIAGLVDVAPDSFDLAWRYVVSGHDVTGILENLASHEYAATETAAGAAQAAEALTLTRVQVIAALADAGLSQRVIGDALGLSQQRIGQLAREAHKAVS